MVTMASSIKPMMIDGHCRLTLDTGTRVLLQRVATLEGKYTLCRLEHVHFANRALDHVLCQVLDSRKTISGLDHVFILAMYQLDIFASAAGSAQLEQPAPNTSGCGFERRMVDKPYKIVDILKVCDYEGNIRILEVGERIRLQCKTSTGLFCIAIGSNAAQETFAVVERKQCRHKMRRIQDRHDSDSSDSDEEDLEDGVLVQDRHDSMDIDDGFEYQHAPAQTAPLQSPAIVPAAPTSDSFSAKPCMSLDQIQRDCKDKTKTITVSRGLLREWFDAMLFYNWAPIPAHTARFFLNVNNKDNLRPEQEPRMIDTAKQFCIANGPQYLYTAIASASNNVVVHEGSDQCKTCISTGHGRFTGCITVETYDNDGTQVFDGSCLRCAVNSKSSVCTKSRTYKGN